MLWSGWGDPALAASLPDAVRELLRAALGVTGGSSPPQSPAAVALYPRRLPEDAEAQLEAIVGAPHARSDHESRVRHLGGRSTPDLLALRAGGPLAAPDLVLAPGSHDQVLALLRCCDHHRVAVTPFGGGTSVVGGLAPDTDGFAGWAALDVARLDALHEIDPCSRLAVLGPGIRGPQAEGLLAPHGFTLGHFPQSFEYATLGGFAAARSSGQASAGYGRFDDRVLALRVATPTGTLDVGRAPKSAAGPDMRQLVLGSEGALGVITSLTLALSRAPERRVYEGWRLPSFITGIELVRRLAQDGPSPTVLRLSDEAETMVGLADPGRLGQGGGGPGEHGAGAGGAPGCLAIVGWEGTDEDVTRRRQATVVLLRAAGAEPVPGAGEEWEAGRFRGPYLRDAFLDAGAFVETLETVAFWSALPGLYAAVSDAVRAALTGAGTPPAILCHISHVYPTGASLYFTVACALSDDATSAWLAAKKAAADAILSAGGSISHHHGVGADHLAPYAREVGELGIAALRAVKRTLDPRSILNPGILVPADVRDDSDRASARSSAG
ncbi:MAG: FAD-binding oxidoreductase [Solirubrobacteraceae bacterium]